MSAWYPWVVLLHLSCAIVFIGAAAFEVLILDALHRQFDRATMERLEQAVMQRARRIMPWVVGLLYLSGAMLFTIRCGGLSCLGSHFGWLLLTKVSLALLVLVVFVMTLRAGSRGRLDPCRFRHTHRVVLALMVGIVFLAKTMFYL
ncbi:hypothetical protein ISN76_03350 [Dyella halodurans]|uniref:Copper resistance protein D domain-containing protein n=1 Tax=Dyella halodurans TaxID=1920171 RepID=A0ABV9BX72_9GAMM|nr:hypothetical protein [Dyella halodurans]